MKSFSTEGLPARRKLPFWNEISSETFAPMEVVPGDRKHFEGRLCRDAIGSLAIADVFSSAGVVHHTEAHVARADDRGYTLVIPVVGGFDIDCGSQPRFTLSTGEFCLLDQRRPYRLTHHEPAQTFCVGLDGRALRDLMPHADRVVGMPMRPVNGMSRMLSSQLTHLSRELEEDHTGSMTPAFAHSLVSFIAAAYSEAVEVSESSMLEARKQRIKLYIDEQLHDPQLHPAAIARHFRISPRYLRLIFESDREPLSAYLLRRRLENCARLLRDPAWRGLTITEVAFRNGFNNLTHFGHAFRKRFGVPPRDYRRMPS